jgi:Mg-chelatase subunit ChlD
MIRLRACIGLLLDSSPDASAVAATEALAAAMRARLIRLDDLNDEAILNILRP